LTPQLVVEGVKVCIVISDAAGGGSLMVFGS
jgi:hypothetical protein